MTPKTASRARVAVAVVLIVLVGCDKAKGLVGHLRSGHGYVFSYNTPENVAETHEPLLRSIVDATTFPRQ